MCLIDKKQFRIAEKDIPIFKVVYKKKYSPFRKTGKAGPKKGLCK